MPTEIRRKEVKTLVAQGRAQLLEVLPANEYRKEHLPKAINIPLEKLTSESTRHLRKDVAVIVYAADHLCDLSARAVWRLESMGFQEVYRYTAGKADWLANGYETEGTHARRPRLKDLANTNVQTCLLRDRMQDVQNRRGNGEICVVMNHRKIVMGIIHGDIWNADPLARVSDVMQPGPRTFRPNHDPKEVLNVMRKEDLEHALVTTSEGELLGVLKRAKKKVQKAPQAEHPPKAA
jgi:rhodanese-related sulfurtransferase